MRHNNAAYPPSGGRDAYGGNDNPFKRWILLVILLAIYELDNAFLLASASPLAEAATLEFHLSPAAAGLIMTMVGASLLAMSLPSGLLIRLLGVGVAGLITASSFLTGWMVSYLTASYSALLIGRAIMGIGGSILGTLGPVLVAGWFPVRSRGLAMGIWMIGLPLGMSWETPLASWLMAACGWRTIPLAGVIMAFASLILMIPLARADGITRFAQPIQSARTDEHAKISSVLRNSKLWRLSFLAFLLFIVWSALSTYLIIWLMNAKGISLMYSGLLAGFLNMAGIFGGPLSGLLSDVFNIGRMRILSLASALSAASIATLLLAPSSFIAILASAVVLGVFLYMSITQVFSTAISIIELRDVSVGMSVVNLSVSGAMILGPVIIGVIYSQTGLSIAMLSLIIACALAALIPLKRF